MHVAVKLMSSELKVSIEKIEKKVFLKRLQLFLLIFFFVREKGKLYFITKGVFYTFEALISK